MSKTYWVYLLASRSRKLYAGVTNSLQRRLAEHRQGLVSGFTTKYKVFRLVYCETFADVRDAIAREKKIKAWRREKKIWLIERHNPMWQDLAGHGFAADGQQHGASPARKARRGTRGPRVGLKKMDHKKWRGVNDG